jgi:predicted nucleic acid-binding protein
MASSRKGFRPNQARSQFGDDRHRVAEVLNYFSETGERMRKAAAELCDQTMRHAKTVVVPQTREVFVSGFDLYKARPDKGYSLTDCISMIEMRERNISDVLTHDRHFSQEGFNLLFQ